MSHHIWFAGLPHSPLSLGFFLFPVFSSRSARLRNAQIELQPTASHTHPLTRYPTKLASLVVACTSLSLITPHRPRRLTCACHETRHGCLVHHAFGFTHNRGTLSLLRSLSMSNRNACSSVLALAPNSSSPRATPAIPPVLLRRSLPRNPHLRCVAPSICQYQ